MYLVLSLKFLPSLIAVCKMSLYKTCKAPSLHLFYSILHNSVKKMLRLYIVLLSFYNLFAYTFGVHVFSALQGEWRY